MENANSETGSFALLFEFDGDIRKIRHVLYNCSASRPTIESKTNEEDKEIQAETLTIKARPMANGCVKAKTGDSTTDAVGLDPALPGSIFLFCGRRTQSALLEQNKKLTEKIEDLTEQIAILNQNRFRKHSETAKQIEGQLSFNDFGTEQKPAHSTTASQRRQQPMVSSHMDT